MCKTVGRADNEILKRKLGVESNLGDALFFFFVRFQLPIAQNQQGRIGIKNLPQGLVDHIRSLFDDHIPVEFRGGMDHKVFPGKLHYLCVIKPAGNNGTAQAIL